MLTTWRTTTCGWVGWSTTRSSGTRTSLRSSTKGRRRQGLEQGRLRRLPEQRLQRQLQRLQRGRHGRLQQGSVQGRRPRKRRRGWRLHWVLPLVREVEHSTSGMARATPRVVTIRSRTMSKRTRTSWRTWRNLGAIAACAPWNTVVRGIARTR